MIRCHGYPGFINSYLAATTTGKQGMFISSPEPSGLKGELNILYSHALESVLIVVVIRHHLANQSQILCGAYLERGTKVY